MLAATKRARKGQATVEFALISILIAALVFGGIEIGRIINTYVILHNAAREGARIGSMCQTSSVIQSYVNTANGGLTLSIATAYLTSAGASGGTGAVGDNIQVTVSTTYTPIAPVFIGPFGVSSTLTAKAAARVDVAATSNCP